MKNYFEYKDEKSSKFWEIVMDGKSVITHYGKIGTKGQTSKKKLATIDLAKKEYDKLIKEKTKKGYKEKNLGSKKASAKNRPKEKTASSKKQSAKIPLWEASLDAIIKSATSQKKAKKEFTFNQKHAVLLSGLHFYWCADENGSPEVDPEKPLGSNNPSKDALDWLKTNGIKATTDEVKSLLTELPIAFKVFISYANLSPGTYEFKNRLHPRKAELDEINASSDSESSTLHNDRLPVYDREIKLHPEGVEVDIDIFSDDTFLIPDKELIKFKLKKEHLKLLKHANTAWSDTLDTISIDAKRPYGDMTNVFIDMKEILKTNASEDSLKKLHTEILFALSVFLQHATLDDDEFYEDGHYKWQKKQ